MPPSYAFTPPQSPRMTDCNGDNSYNRECVVVGENTFEITTVSPKHAMAEHGKDAAERERWIKSLQWEDQLQMLIKKNTIESSAKDGMSLNEEEICLCPKMGDRCGQKTRMGYRVRVGRQTLLSTMKRHKKVVMIVAVALLSFILWLYALLSAKTLIPPSRNLDAQPAAAKTKAIVPASKFRPDPATTAKLAKVLPSFTLPPEIELRADAETERVMDIYCRGPILHAVQMANVYSDSKHFVDMPIKTNSSPFDIIMDFQQRKLAMTEFQPDDHTFTHDVMLRHFIEDHFDPPGTDLSPITPFDYQEHQIPPMIADIQDPGLREWAVSLHHLWRTLGRVPNTQVRSSYLHAKAFADPRLRRPQNILIVPGGRFRESYYWDSYWIVQGLIVSDMRFTARGIVNNLLEYVAEFGFVPNGGRIYYLTRSQPPMLSDMVKLVARTGKNNEAEVEYDEEYLKAAVPVLEKEYRFWMQLGPSGHAVEIVKPSRGEDGVTRNVTHVLNRYTSSANHPRPESYREDVVVAAAIYGHTVGMDAGNAASTESKDMYYNDVIAAAESGWDFSSRWFRQEADMKTMFTSAVIPVDLNAIMYRMERNLMRFHEYLGNSDRVQYFRSAAERRLEAMDEILWSEEFHSWKDFNMETMAHSRVISVSDFTPLWAKAFDPNDTKRLQAVIQALQDSGLLQIGGIQTTNTFTGQQWDAPNAWPPEQDIVMEGLLAVNTQESHELARELMRNWVRTSFTAWKQTGLMFEKYNATEVGGLGVGGEYFPQFGFGWTNGVILKFLTIHQNLLP
uniref:Trehalase n=1 Tax=Globisporangium ultimum (strain ATCC 200006 / CBS 805.95 / DAOM BR144) TaxID=431595 RepID=K3WZ98_GLOUD